MQKIADFVNFAVNNNEIDSSVIQSVQGYLSKDMTVDGWISLIMGNRECVILLFNNRAFMD